jgi:hypothetical protein
MADDASVGSGAVGIVLGVITTSVHRDAMSVVSRIMSTSSCERAKLCTVRTTLRKAFLELRIHQHQRQHVECSVADLDRRERSLGPVGHLRRLVEVLNRHQN